VAREGGSAENRGSDLDAASVAELRAKGADIAEGPVVRNPGLYLAIVRGPEGVMVGLVQR
jgi:hypothetical protein